MLEFAHMKVLLRMHERAAHRSAESKHSMPCILNLKLMLHHCEQYLLAGSAGRAHTWPSGWPAALHGCVKLLPMLLRACVTDINSFYIIVFLCCFLIQCEAGFVLNRQIQGQEIYYCETASKG